MDESTLEWICRLAQIELNPSEKQKLILDVEKLLEHFQILSQLPSQNPKFQDRRIYCRKDKALLSPLKVISGIVENFPEQSGGMLNISEIQPEAEIGE